MNILADYHIPFRFSFSADIAESLSRDMQKESLWGRTLTLKLKTSAFEVFCLHSYR